MNLQEALRGLAQAVINIEAGHIEISHGSSIYEALRFLTSYHADDPYCYQDDPEGHETPCEHTSAGLELTDLPPASTPVYFTVQGPAGMLASSDLITIYEILMQPEKITACMNQVRINLFCRRYRAAKQSERKEP